MTGVRIVVAWAIGIVALVVAGHATRAEEQFKMLDEKQISARVVGKDITDGPHWSMYLRPDGVMISAESGGSWVGSWKIRNNKLCIFYPASAPGAQPECNEVWMSGTNVRMRPNGDQETISAIVMAHRGAADRQEPLKFVQTCLTVETLQCENLSSLYPRWPFFLPSTVRHRPSPARTAPSNRRLA